MAQKTLVQLTDDLDGSTAEETIALGFRGTNYELDLNAENAAALEKVLSKYLDAARRVPARAAGRPARTSRKPRSKGAAEDVAAIRACARKQRYQVSERGRISAEVRGAYEAASG